MGDGARLWLTGAAAAGTTKIRVKMDEAVTLSKLFNPAEVDWALGHAAVQARFGHGDLASILDHNATATTGVTHRAGEAIHVVTNASRGLTHNLLEVGAMKRPVALRYIIIAAVVALTLSACDPTSATSAKSASKPAAAAKHAADTLPGLGSKCDQNTRAKYIPDNSKWAPLPGGAPNFRDFSSKILSIKSKGVYSAIVDASEAMIGDNRKMVDAVMCPDGMIYELGNPIPWTHSARLLNANPNGVDVKRGMMGLYSHPARDVISRPCPAALFSILPDRALEIFWGVCLDNGAIFDAPQIPLSVLEGK